MTDQELEGLFAARGEQCLTIEHACNRIRAGLPLSWITVEDGDRIFEIATAPKKESSSLLG
jgi:hypothetical protein